MFRFIVAVMAALALAAPLKVQADDIEGVIGSQIEAFQRDDFTTAFTYASPAIRGIFQTPERFGQMVRQGFPMVWRPAEVEYLDSRAVGAVTYQNVLIRDTMGAFHTLEYEMIPVGDGWQINGVRFLQEPAVSA